MLEMQYVDDSERYAVNFRTVAENIVELAGTFPQKECGFKVFRPGSADVLGDYSAYVTVYRQTGNGTQFSSDGSVFAEPEPVPDPGPYEPTPEELEKWEQQRKEDESVPTNKELSDAVMEIAENISDIEDSIAELGSILTIV